VLSAPMAGSRFATNRIIVAAVELHSIPPQMIVPVGPLGPSHGPGESRRTLRTRIET
jgi:hypothetical protein